ncbi:MAG: hypothetical protein FWH43_05740 [Endomicrobia bacterium]|nr:hypothetical protein [Endomicrobiia bacterium]
MPTNVFDIKEVFTAAWEGFTKNAVLLIVLPLALVIASILVYAISMVFMIIPFLFLLVTPVVAVIEIALSAYVFFCMIKVSLAVLKGETPSWDILKTDPASFIRFAAVLLIVGVATAIVSTVITFIFPAILGANLVSLFIVMLLTIAITVGALTFFFPAQFIIVDKKDISIIDSIKNSWNMTFPRAAQCLIFILICFVINFIGSIPLGLGLIVTMPVTFIAAAIVYKKLDAAPSETPSAPEVI